MVRQERVNIFVSPFEVTNITIRRKMSALSNVVSLNESISPSFSLFQEAGNKREYNTQELKKRRRSSIIILHLHGIHIPTETILQYQSHKLRKSTNFLCSAQTSIDNLLCLKREKCTIGIFLEIFCFIPASTASLSIFCIALYPIHGRAFLSLFFLQAAELKSRSRNLPPSKLPELAHAFSFRPLFYYYLMLLL